MKRTIAVSLLLGLSACGGGHGTASGNMGPSSVDFGTAVTNLVSNGWSAKVALSGSVKGNPITGTGTYVLSPAVSATFAPVSGAAAYSQTLNTAFNMTAGGTIISATAQQGSNTLTVTAQ